MEAYFYTGIQGHYIHSYACIAEGLGKYNVKLYADYDFMSGDKCLIKHDDNYKIEDADIVFIHSSLYYKNLQANRIVTNINRQKRKYITVFIDDSDGVRTPGFSKGAQSCNWVLKSHYNRKYKYPSNFIPWQFGLSERIINAVNPLPFNERNNNILVNFRVKHQLRDCVNHLIRPIVEKIFEWDNKTDDFTSEGLDGNDLLFWKQTGARHYPAYYSKLSKSKLCACYGGVFAIPTGNNNKYTAKIARLINTVIPLYEWDRVRQWDSWRLWEAWAAGCCVLHIDLEKYGCLLPVMPKNGIHYIGIDIKNPFQLGDLLSNEAERPEEQSLLEEIAANGRDFALRHYSPEKVAERLLEMYNSCYAKR
jgi:hypothetical protein